VRLLSAQFMAAQELERRRIALELHDGIGQALGGVKFGLESCEALIASGASGAAAQKIAGLVARIQSVVEEVRRISMNLRPSTLDDLGILPTLGWFAREFRAIYQQPHLATLVDVSEDEIAVPIKTAIYRIVQEACNNVVTHSMARKVSLILRRYRSHIELQVHDDGAGFDPAGFTVADDSGRGLGLASMRERAEVTGGRFSLHSQASQGTTVRVVWPRRRPRAAA
jgi:signal transduction histidine kinase